ncbi:hypothetical protein H4R35_007284, partial [Dimargaris xerosporica]
MLRYSRSLTTATVTSMVLLVLLVVAVNGLPPLPEYSEWSINAYNHTGRATLSRRALTNLVNKLTQRFSRNGEGNLKVAYPKYALSSKVFNLIYNAFKKEIGFNMIHGNIFYWPDLKQFKPALLEELSLWENDLDDPDDLYSLDQEISEAYRCSSKDCWLVNGIIVGCNPDEKSAVDKNYYWVRPSIIRLLTDMKVLQEKTALATNSCPFLDPHRTMVRLTRIIEILESIAGNQMKRMYDVVVVFRKFLSDKKIADSDSVDYMYRFIHEKLMGGVPLAVDSINKLAKVLVDQSLNPGHDSVKK